MQEHEYQLDELDNVTQYSANNSLKTVELFRGKFILKIKYLGVLFTETSYFKKQSENLEGQVWTGSLE